MTVEQLREEGNNFFREKNYFKAYDCYTKAIEACDKENKNLLSILYSNLSASARYIEKNQEAVEAATKSIECDPSNFKGYLRRGDAYADQLNWEDCYNDYLAAAKLQPNEGYFRQKLEMAKSKLKAKCYLNAFSSTCEPTLKIETPKPMEPVKVMPKSMSKPEMAHKSVSIDDMEFTPENVKEFMKRLMNEERPKESTVISMLHRMKEMMEVLPNIVDIKCNNYIRIVGDTHGQFQDVISIFETYGYPSRENPYLFNGDYVDRGSMGIEICLSLFAWKMVDPLCVFLNRGNHESDTMNMMYGFQNECVAKYSRSCFDEFSKFFNFLPLGHIINDRVLIVHGGLFGDQKVTISDIQKYCRFCQPPESGPLNDILWSDPMDQPGFAPSPRGVTRTFGPDVTEKFLKANNLELLVRSHQVQEGGYYVQHNGKCVTVFSAPNYIGQMGNLGAVLLIRFDQDGSIIEKKYDTFTAKAIPPKYQPMKYAYSGWF